MATTDYPYLPPECRNGHCDHEPDRCVRFRSRRCEAGQCTHARQNLLCAVDYPTDTMGRPVIADPNPNGCRWCGIDERGHARQWHAFAGWHAWEQPTQQQIRDRMTARRVGRT